MSQDSLIILLFKIVVVADLVAIAAFIADYSRLAAWYKNPIGRTLVIKDLLLGAAFIPSVLSFFFKFNRLTSHIAAWIDIALFAGIAAVMTWRTVVFERIHRDKAAAGSAPEEGEEP